MGISGDEWKKNRYNNIKIDAEIRVGWIMGDDMMGIIKRRIEKEDIRNLEIVGYVMNVRKTMRGDRGIFCEEVFETRRKKERGEWKEIRNNEIERIRKIKEDIKRNKIKEIEKKRIAKMKEKEEEEINKYIECINNNKEIEEEDKKEKEIDEEEENKKRKK